AIKVSGTYRPPYTPNRPRSLEEAADEEEEGVPRPCLRDFCEDRAGILTSVFRAAEPIPNPPSDRIPAQPAQTPAPSPDPSSPAKPQHQRPHPRPREQIG